MTRFVPCSAALLALAAPAAAATADVSLAWGDALASALQAAGSVLVPLAVTALTAALARIAGPLRVLITASLVERHAFQGSRGRQSEP